MTSSDCLSSSCCSSDSDTLVTSIRAMRQRENDYLTGDYLHQTSFMSCAEPVDADCRSKMCQWCIQIVDHCQFNRETVAIATNFLDRFLEASPWALMDRSAFQLAAITSLYTSVKIHEPQAIAVETMANLSRNVYSADQIEAMERVMLKANNWLIHSPTAFAFSHFFCELMAGADPRYDFETLLDLTKLQLESALQDYELSLILPSSVAFGAVMNAIEGMSLFSPQALKEMETFLASAAKIDSESPRMQDIQIRLYEGLLEGSSLPPKAIGGCESRSSAVRPASPRSVSAVRTVSPH